jgi:hypothetical protein
MTCIATNELPSSRLPICLKLHDDELLSSWIRRLADFYAVSPLAMLRHCLAEVSSLRAADLHLNDHQQIRLAEMFAAEPAHIRQMTFTNVRPPSYRFIAMRPLQCCTRCNPIHAAPMPLLRNQLLGWRITCPRCGDLLRDGDGREVPFPFRQYHSGHSGREAARR